MKVRNVGDVAVTLLVVGAAVDGIPPSVTIAPGEEVEADFRKSGQLEGYVHAGVIVRVETPKPEKK